MASGREHRRRRPQHRNLGCSERPCARKPAPPNSAAKPKPSAICVAKNTRARVRDRAGALAPTAAPSDPDVDVDAPSAQITNATKNGGGRHRAGRGLGPPGDRNRCGGEQREGRERHRIVPARERQEGCGHEIGRERDRRHAVDLAFFRIRSEQQARDDQDRRQRKAGDDVEGVCAQRLDRRPAHAWERP